MKNLRPISFAVLATLAACTARGGNSSSTDPPDAFDEASMDDAAVTPDQATPPDVVKGLDAPTFPDRVIPSDGPTPFDTPPPPPPPDVVTGDVCTRFCARSTVSPGCSTDRAACVSECNTSLGRFPVCRGALEALLECGTATGVSCTGGTGFTFPGCPSQQSAAQACLLPMLDAGAPDGSTGNPATPCVGSFSGLERECGWVTGRSFSCVSGRTVTIGCNTTVSTDPLCASAIGSCTGDAVLRVCAGAAPCTAAAALNSEDDSCGGLCPVLQVTCPSSGSVYVMAGAYSDGRPGTCTPALR